MPSAYPCPCQVGCNCVCASEPNVFVYCAVCLPNWQINCPNGIDAPDAEECVCVEGEGVQVVISSALVTATEQAQLPQFRISISPVACAREKGGR